jgi:hypothetical protein
MAVVVAYRVLQAESKEQLETLVKEMIAKGWQPLGGIAISDKVFYQAIAGH